MLVGLILAFVGAIELKMFGAQIFVADVVGIGMVRIMGAIMTGIIMAGRTGASFAAQIGTMQVNEEIDALQTLGISPMEFLVLPRMVALIVMMPLLCLYADLMGIVGGIVVGTGMLDLSLTEYLNRTREAVTMTHLWIGLFHSAVFGVLVAMAGCLRGMQCGRSASAVGEATTSAVVTSIVAIVVATAVITFACQVAGDISHHRGKKSMTGEPLIIAKDLDMGYGEFVVMRDLNFTVNRGDIFIIMGASGCGKSTLLKILIGLKRPLRGKVLYGDTSFWETDSSERERMMRRFGILYQYGALGAP